MQSDGSTHYGSFLSSFAHAYEHADGDNQAILDPAFELFDIKYDLSGTFTKVRGYAPKDTPKGLVP